MSLKQSQHKAAQAEARLERSSSRKEFVGLLRDKFKRNSGRFAGKQSPHAHKWEQSSSDTPKSAQSIRETGGNTADDSQNMPYNRRFSVASPAALLSPADAQFSSSPTPTLRSPVRSSDKELSEGSSPSTPGTIDTGSDADVPGHFPEHTESNDVEQLTDLIHSINSIPSWLGFTNDPESAAEEEPRDIGNLPADPNDVDYFNFKAPSSVLRHTMSDTATPSHHQTSDDDAWSIVSAGPADTVTNGEPDNAPTVSQGHTPVPLKELEQIELELFLKNFGRHTREVRMLGNEKRATRMPQWSDFAYSSSEEEQEEEDEIGHYISRVHAKPKRSRLLTHIDRGLQNMHEDAPPAQSPRRSHSEERLSRSWSSDRIPQCHSHGLKRSNSSKSMPRYRQPQTPMEQSAAEDEAQGNQSDSRAPRNKHVRIATQEEHVDGVAFLIAYCLALVEHFAPADLDEAPIVEYRESRARSHVERLYIIAPFWEQLERNMRALYRWERPRATAAALMIYFVLWYTDMLPAALIITIIYYVAHFRFMPPSESYLHRKVQERMQRGRDADKLAERLKRRSRLDMLDIYKSWQDKYGVSSQIFVSDVADFHEKVKNLLLWRNPPASRRTLAMLTILFGVTCTISAAMLWKSLLFLLGFDFFGLMALRSHYPRYRRPLNPLWWFVLGSPNDAQYAVYLLREKHLKHNHAVEHMRRSQTDSTFVSERPSLPAENLVDLSPLAEPLVADMVEQRSKSRGKKYGSFFCQHRGVPGHLQITNKIVYFSPLYVGPIKSRSCVTPLEEIDALLKTNQHKLWVWLSHGLRIARKGRSTLHFTNMARRDDAFNLLLTLGSESAYCR